MLASCTHDPDDLLGHLGHARLAEVAVEATLS